jgi:TRAP-type C4-dicarboxylate transport system substrate-binding protein
LLLLVPLLLALSGCSGRANEPAPQHIFRYAENQTADYPTTLGAYRFAELVWERTEGRIQIVVYPDAKLGD